MATQRLRGLGLIGLAAGLLWGFLTVVELSPAQARMAGARGGFHGGFATGFRGSLGGGFSHRFHAGFGHGFHGGFGVGFHHGFHGPFRHHFFVHRFRHRNVFFFNVGVGGFFPYYPVAYPYPVYSPYYQPYYYSPCGYYDAYGTWVNAPCPQYGPQYAPPLSAPQQWSPPAGLSTPPAQPGEGGQGTQPPGY